MRNILVALLFTICAVAATEESYDRAVLETMPSVFQGKYRVYKHHSITMRRPALKEPPKWVPPPWEDIEVFGTLEVTLRTRSMLIQSPDQKSSEVIPSNYGSTHFIYDTYKGDDPDITHTVAWMSGNMISTVWRWKNGALYYQEFVEVGDMEVRRNAYILHVDD